MSDGWSHGAPRGDVAGLERHPDTPIRPQDVTCLQGGVRFLSVCAKQGKNAIDPHFIAIPAGKALARTCRGVLSKRLQTRKAICCLLHGILAHMGVMLAHLLAVVAYHLHDHSR